MQAEILRGMKMLRETFFGAHYSCYCDGRGGHVTEKMAERRPEINASWIMDKFSGARKAREGESQLSSEIYSGEKGVRSDREISYSNRMPNVFFILLF